MKKITISDDQCAALNGSSTPNEVCDPTGQIVGYLISPEKYAELLAAKEEADIAELDRRALDTDVGTLQELWKELGVERAADIPAGIIRSRAALRKDLPELLARRRNRDKWVCYHREQRIGLSDDYAELIRECNRRQIPSGEYIIERITPTAGSEEEVAIEIFDV